MDTTQPTQDAPRTASHESPATTVRLYDLFLDVRRVTGYTLSEVRHMPIREFWAAVAYDQRQKGQAGQMMAMMLLR